MAECLIALGSNLGDRSATLAAAADKLRDWPQIELLAISRWHPTAPIGGPAGQGEFLNGALRLATTLSPRALMNVLQQLQLELGRQEHQRWDARTIDLDLLLYDDLVLRDEQLEIPHPRMPFRRFVLAPAVEIAADMVHPTTGWTLDRLVRHLDQTPPYVAVTGSDLPARQAIAGQAQRQLGAQLIASAPPVDEELENQTTHLPTSIPTGCPGLAPAVAIQFLQQRATLLAEPARWSPGSSSATRWISDFWLAESLAWGAYDYGDDARFQSLLTAYEQLAPRVATPRFVVLVEPAKTSSPAQQTCFRAFERRAEQADSGPVLRVKADELEWAVTQTVAAFQSTQT